MSLVSLSRHPSSFWRRGNTTLVLRPSNNLSHSIWFLLPWWSLSLGCMIIFFHLGLRLGWIFLNSSHLFSKVWLLMSLHSHYPQKKSPFTTKGDRTSYSWIYEWMLEGKLIVKPRLFNQTIAVPSLLRSMNSPTTSMYLVLK